MQHETLLILYLDDDIINRLWNVSQSMARRIYEVYQDLNKDLRKCRKYKGSLSQNYSQTPC